MAQYYNRNMYLSPGDPGRDEDYDFDEDYDRYEAEMERRFEGKREE